MMKRKALDLWVGVFVAIGLGALLFLALKVGNLASFSAAETYLVKANFDNIGGLKKRAPVKSAGVVVGRVEDIGFDTETYEATVAMSIDKRYEFPKDTSAKILTCGPARRAVHRSFGRRRYGEVEGRRQDQDHPVRGGAGESDQPVPVQQGGGRQQRQQMTASDEGR